MYNPKLAEPVLRPRAPEPGTDAATLVEVKAIPRRLQRPAHRLGREFQRTSSPARNSPYNRGWRWHLQLWAGVFAIVEGLTVIAITVTLLQHL